MTNFKFQFQFQSFQSVQFLPAGSNLRLLVDLLKVSDLMSDNLKGLDGMGQPLVGCF